MTLTKNSSKASETQVFCASPNGCHFNMLVSAAAESFHIIFTCLLSLDVKFIVLKFSGFIMNNFFILALFLSFSLQHLPTFPPQTLHMSLCPSSCPDIRRMGSCASQLLFQQFPVGVSGDYRIVQVTRDYPLNGGQHLRVIPA